MCLFALCYLLISRESDREISSVGEWIKHLSLPVISAGVAFLAGSLVCRTPLGGIIWGVGAWFVPGSVATWLSERKKASLRNHAKSFIATASGLYAAGQVTPEVIKTSSARFPEPLAGEFHVMQARRNTDSKASFPVMFERLAAKYDLPEFKAVASIVAASERAGGPRAAAEGLKQLSLALRSRDRRIKERRKETMEPLIAAGFAIVIIIAGFVADVTVLSHYYDSAAGKILLSAMSALIVVMVAVVLKAVDLRDLMGGT